MASSLDWSQPVQGGNTFGVANLTNDPIVRDWANYHNCQCWSSDGRYVCFTRFASDGKRYGNQKASEVHVFDLHTGEDQTVANGQHPRWANDHNWLFYIRFVDGDPAAEGTEVWWLDVETGHKTLLGHGLTNLGGISHDDTYLFGMVRVQSGSPFLSYRFRIQENAKREYIPGMDGGFQWIANPQHNVVFARVPNREEDPFSATRYWCDIDGSNIRVGSVTLERCHQSWLGNGAYYLLGNSQVRGRKWDQPFPSSLHFLANIRTGDISPCGRNGRFVVGDKPLSMADLRSGHGWYLLEDLSIICYPSHIGDNSGPYDSDAKGSPDGTKICFVSNYDLKEGTVTFITKSASPTDTRVEVQSTEEFPETGEIVVFREVIGYTHKTPTSFEGLERKRYDTSGFGLHEYSDLAKGEAVTPFEARCIPEDQWKTLSLPDSGLEKTIGSLDSPLIRQKSTDIWAVIVRLPDRPYLRQIETGPELIPGESHYETFGYHLFKDGQRITDQPVHAPTSFEIAEAGTYTAVAVENCGIESKQSNTLDLQGGQTLVILNDAPAGFSWTYDRWFVDGETVDLVQSMQSENAQRAIYHRYDGPIAREWYAWGSLTARHDLNGAGVPTRQCTYHQGHLFCRKYYTGNRKHLSTEYFDVEDNVTEMILHQEQKGQTVEYDHWWYDRGMPVRRIGRTPARRIDSDTPVMYVLSGDQWVLQDHVGDRPHEARIAAEQTHTRE